MSTSMNDDEYRLFSEWVAGEYGLHFGPEKREILRARLEPRRVALGLDSFERLLFRVRYHPDREAERERLVSQLTNNESYFFRESRQLDVLRTELLPELGRQARRDGRPVRLLSAGSASGEEPYSLGIVSRQALGSTADVAVTGIDVDREALERARAARYRPHALRGMDPETRDRYFEAVGDETYQLREPFRAAAQFQQGNLVDPDWPGSLPPQDVVFCRNVLIYFQAPALRRAAENLFRVVRPGGYLFLGHAESFSRVPTRFIPERRPGAVFYRRPE